MYAYKTKNWHKNTPDSAFPRTLPPADCEMETQYSVTVFVNLGEYCKFGNFRENYIFANNVKKHICDVKKS